MQFSTSIIMTSALAALVIAMPNNQVRTSSYPRVDMQFVGTIAGHQVALNGSAQSIMAQAEKIIPGFNAEEYMSSISKRSLPDLTTRNKDGLLCCPVAGQAFGNAEEGPILDGISYLNGLSGGCGVGAHSCSRISCSQDSAIELCNDNSYDIAPSCNYLASYASDINNQCAQGCTDPGSGCDFNPFTAVCGQEFDSDNYNIVVSRQGC